VERIPEVPEGHNELREAQFVNSVEKRPDITVGEHSTKFVV
jgi:hypothetical protein